MRYTDDMDKNVKNKFVYTYKMMFSKIEEMCTCQGYSPESVSLSFSILPDILVFETPQSKYSYINIL